MLELYEEKLPLTLCHTSLLHSDNRNSTNVNVTTQGVKSVKFTACEGENI